MTAVHDVATVRAAEARLMEGVPEGTLMDRAATGLADACATLMTDAGMKVNGARVVLLVGSGNNGGDALYAGALLAGRGARVDAIVVGDGAHGAGVRALKASGGAIHSGDGAPPILDAADVVLDGIVGIGGRGALRPDAASWARMARQSGALIIAVDVPSGVDADTGAIADIDAVVDADVTVTFGCLKPGLLLSPGRDRAGAVILVDIGLSATLPEAVLATLSADDLAQSVPEPGADDYKYSRGVVGVAAGSRRYRGAAFLTTGSARQGSTGMVHLLDRGDGLAEAVVDRFWDVVTSTDAPESVARATGWVVGPGLGVDPDAQDVLVSVLRSPHPVVVDADALRMLRQEAPWAAASSRAVPTVLTPHLGEFAGLGFGIGLGPDEDRLGAARRAAAELGMVVVLKGPGTVIAAPSGLAFIDTWGTADLGSAGSGDVLAGLTGALLAGAAVRGAVDSDAAARIAAAAVGLHGVAGRLAAGDGRPVTAPDIIMSLPAAIAAVRRGVGL